MIGVIKKKRKTLLANIVDKIKDITLSCEQGSIIYDASFHDIRISADEIAAIASRRVELKIIEHDNSDATIIYESWS